MRRPYYILAPEYQHNSAGIRVLYKLWGELHNAGEDSTIISSLQEIPENAVAIYPEIYKGNPLRAKHVARYVLNKPGLIGGDKIYNEKEMVFVYAKPFVESVQNKISGMLHAPSVDLEVFYNKEYFHRPHSCYWVGKGIFDEKKLKFKNPIEITRNFPRSREILAELFNRCSVFYNYDPATILVQEAALCGCPVVDLSGNEAEYKVGEVGTDGVTFIDTEEEIEKARITTSAVKKRFIQLEETFKQQLQDFIRITQGES